MTRTIARGITARSPIARGITARSPFAIASPFTPGFLFQDGQQGVWYEPKPVISGQQILYQDAAGTIPVTADGDPVGLMLDLHAGLVLGPELITNGAFDTDISGWTNPAPARGEILWVSPGYLRIDGTNGDGSAPVARQTLTLPAGSSYEIRWSVPQTTVTNGGNKFETSGNLGIDGVSETDDGYKVVIHPSSDQLWIQFYGVSSEIVDFDNISIKELPGNHATQSTSAARPVYRTDGVLQRVQADGVDDRVVFSPVSMTGPLTISVGLRSASPSNTHMILGSSNSTDLQKIGHANGEWFVRLVSGGATISAGAPDTEPHVLTVVRDSSNTVSLRVDGVPIGSMSSSGTCVFDEFLSTENTEQRWEGDSFGAVVIEKELSGDELQNTEAYLAKLSGVTL